MIEPARLTEIIELVLRHSTADATEVMVWAEQNNLTRFANSTIHQNVAETNVQVRVRAVAGRRQGVAASNDVRPEKLTALADQALQAARLQPEGDADVLLAGPATYESVQGYSAATADCSPQRRAEAVTSVCRLSDEAGLVASGAFSAGAWAIALGNTRGLAAQHAGSSANFTTVIMSEDSSGYAQSSAWNIDDLDVETLGREAIDTARRSRQPRRIEAGVYPVVLRPYATASILGTLGYLGLGALALQEKRSFMTDRLGRYIASPLVNIWDDGLDPRGIPMPFDYQGVPKQRVSLIHNGVAQSVVYDLETAHREGRQSTGHGLPSPNTFGPTPMHLFMTAGDVPLEGLIASVDRGLLITRFHYTVPVHPRQTTTTGMTRDGTFWIEKGEIAYPVKNLRFTQSYLEALDNVEILGREARLIDDGEGAAWAPAFKCSAFRFTGVTEF